MALFLLIALPLFMVFVLSFSRFTARDMYVFLEGTLIGVIGIILVYVTRRLWQVSYRTLNLYIHNTAIDILIPQALLLVTFYLSNRKVAYRGGIDVEEIFFNLVDFSCGFYFILSISDFLRSYDSHDIFLLIFIPLIRIILLTSTGLLLKYFLGNTTKNKLLIFAGYFFYLLLIGGIELAYYVNYKEILVASVVILFLSNLFGLVRLLGSASISYK